MELLVLITLAVLAIPLAEPADVTGHRMNIFGAFGSALKKIGAAAAPIVGGIIGGPVGAALGSAASGFLGGGDDSTAGKVGRIASAAVPAFQAVKSSRQAGRDSERSRALLDQAIGLSTGEAERAQAEFAAGAPLRQEFRNVALNFGDPTNPFAQRAGASAAQAGGEQALAESGRIFQIMAEAMKKGKGAEAPAQKPSKPRGGIAGAASKVRNDDRGME